MDKKVLIVDDSAFIREILTDIIGQISGFTVIGTAPDPHVAAQMIVDLKPDILTLDIEMPKMDGLTFLEKIIRLKPIPVLVISSLVEGKSNLGLKALELGAIDYVVKPTEAIREKMSELKADISRKLQACAVTKMSNTRPRKSEIDAKYKAIENNVSGTKGINFSTTDKVIAIGSSTGGTGVIADILKDLPVNMPGIVIVQHMPAGFTHDFAKRLNGESNLYVKEAEDGDTILAGQVLIAPGNYHLEVLRSGTKFYVKLNQNDPISYSRPSVDVLFNSVAKTMGENSVGVILTGMGGDGADGMLAMKDAGSVNYAQNEASCIVYGMPKVAVEKGGVHEILNINQIKEKLLKFAL